MMAAAKETATIAAKYLKAREFADTDHRNNLRAFDRVEAGAVQVSDEARQADGVVVEEEDPAKGAGLGRVGGFHGWSMQGGRKANG